MVASTDRCWQAHRAAWPCLISLAALLSAHSGSAQAVYKWTDQSGVVHFSDSPPEGGQTYEERGVQPAETSRRAAPAAGVAGPTGAQAPADTTAQPAPEGATPAGASAKADQYRGTARVILASQESLTRGPQARHLIGTVKNVGGQIATRVAVTAHVTDLQGGECQREAVEVSPSTLDPGESGNFDATIESPCILEGGNIDAEPTWE